MRPTVLIVADESSALLGLAHAAIKFGYQILTAHPERAEIERAQDLRPSLVIVRPPTDPEGFRRCAEIVRSELAARCVPILACLASSREAEALKPILPKAAVLVGNPLSLNELYRHLQELLDMSRRKELRIRTDLVVAHREPGLYQDDFYFYDTMTSLSSGGCFIRTSNVYPLGTRIEALFCVGSASRCLRVTGRVCRHGSGPAEEQGMGVQFEDVPEEVRRLLDAYLVSQVGTAELPSTL